MLAGCLAAGCLLACLALATADDPAGGRRAGPQTCVAAALVVLSATALVLKVAQVGPFGP